MASGDENEQVKALKMQRFEKVFVFSQSLGWRSLLSLATALDQPGIRRLKLVVVSNGHIRLNCGTVVLNHIILGQRGVEFKTKKIVGFPLTNGGKGQFTPLVETATIGTIKLDSSLVSIVP